MNQQPPPQQQTEGVEVMATMNDELLEHDLRKRLKDAEKVLREFERQYKGDTRMYADQIEYVNALRGSLASLP